MGNAVGNAVGNAEGCTSAKDEIGQMLWAWGQSLNQGGDTEPATVCSSGVKSASLAPTGPSTAAGAHGAFNRSGVFLHTYAMHMKCVVAFAPYWRAVVPRDIAVRARCIEGHATEQDITTRGQLRLGQLQYVNKRSIRRWAQSHRRFCG